MIFSNANSAFVSSKLNFSVISNNFVPFGKGFIVFSTEKEGAVGLLLLLLLLLFFFFLGGGGLINLKNSAIHGFLG